MDLTITAIDAIALVDDGDNPDSKIMLAKRREGERQMSKEATELTLPDEVQKQLDQVPELRKELEDQKSAWAKLKDLFVGKNKDDEEKTREAVPAAVQKRLDEQAAEVKESREEVAKIRAERRREQMIAKVAQYQNIPGLSADDFATVLEAQSDENLEKLEKVLKAADGAVKNSGVLTEIGVRGAADDNSPEGKIEKAAQEIRKGKETKMTIEQARVQAYKDHPELCAQLRGGE